MTLDSYLDANGLSAKKFAASIGVTHQAIWYWRTGIRIPRRDLMRKIAEVTEGAVMPNDFIPTHESEPIEAAE